MRLILIPTCLALWVSLAACGSSPELNPLADPRLQPFIATSDMPVPPNVERAASSDQCAGEPLRAINASLPEYPARGWSRGLQGWSIVQFDVTQAGEVQNVSVARGVPGGSFDHEARRAVEDWRFAPLSEGAALQGCVVLFEFTQGEVRIR
jgi:TonB family protein